MRSTSAVTGLARDAWPGPARRLLVAVVGIALAVLLGAPAGGAGGGKIAGWGSDGKLTARFVSGVALWEAPKRYVHLGFLPSAPAPEERAGFLQLTWWPPSVKVPAMSLCLKFKDGETAASISSLEQYCVAFWNYPQNPYSTPNTMNYVSNDWNYSGGVQELSGDLRKGGRIRGKFAREWLFDSPAGIHVRYQWSLEFDALLE